MERRGRGLYEGSEEGFCGVVYVGGLEVWVCLYSEDVVEDPAKFLCLAFVCFLSRNDLTVPKTFIILS
jgi:hypothetical protein